MIKSKQQEDIHAILHVRAILNAVQIIVINLLVLVLEIVEI